MATRSLAETIAKHNQLAATASNEPQRPSAKVRVLVESRYNGPDLKARNAKVGDVIDVAGGRYAQDLIASGLVEMFVEEPEDSHSATDLDALSVTQLRALAQERGIETKGLKKGQLIEALGA